MEPARGRSRSPRGSPPVKAGPPQAHFDQALGLQNVNVQGFAALAQAAPQPQLAQVPPAAAPAEAQLAQAPGQLPAVQPAAPGVPPLAAPGLPALPGQLPLPGQTMPAALPGMPGLPGQELGQAATGMTPEQLKQYQEQAYQQYLLQYQQQMAYAMAMQQQQMMMLAMNPQAMLLQQQALLGGLSGAGAAAPKASTDHMQSPAAKAMSPNGDVPGLTDKRFESKIVMVAKSREFGFVGCCPDLAYQLNGKDIFINKSDVGSLNTGDLVSFGVRLLRDGKPQAKELMLITAPGGEASAPAPGLAPDN